MTYDELYPGGPRFLRAPGAFKLGTDSVLLADFTPAKAGSVLDLGCGAGVLMILLADKAPTAKIQGVEIDPTAAALCRENLAANGLSQRCSVIHGDLRQHRELFTAGGYELVMSNPPYFPEGSGYTAPDAQRATARDERSCTLGDICAAARYLLRWGGIFTMVHRPERLSEVLCAMSAAELEPKRLRMVQHKAESAPSLFLVEGRRGGKPGLRIEPPLILTDGQGGDSAEIKSMYHRG